MTTIEWTHVPDGKGGRKKGETWNPQVGCSEVSPGCRNCYAARFAGRGTSAQHRGLTIKRSNGVHWNGELRRVPELLEKPLHWREPRGVFVGSMTDIFHEDAVATEEGRRFIAAIFGVMAACPQHTFMLLTKRPAKMREWFEWLIRGNRGWSELAALIDEMAVAGEAPSALLNTARQPWPLPNVWIGTTVEDQQRADERIPELLRVPAAVRFLSCEPLLRPVDLGEWLETATWCSECRRPVDQPRESDRIDSHHRRCSRPGTTVTTHGDAAASAFCRGQGMPNGIDWIIIGGESGPGARPMHPDWARSLVTQGSDAGVPVLFKQWGAIGWPDQLPEETIRDVDASDRPEILDTGSARVTGIRLGKKATGRELDGRTWDEFPEVDL